MNKRYKVIEDLQCGEFGMGRNYTIRQWRCQAIDWCYMDESFGIMKEVFETPDENLIDYIAEWWTLRFEEVNENEPLDKYDLTDYEDKTVEEFFNERYCEDNEYE